MRVLSALLAAIVFTVAYLYLFLRITLHRRRNVDDEADLSSLFDPRNP